MKLPVSLSTVYILSPARTQWDLKGEKIKKICSPQGWVTWVSAMMPALWKKSFLLHIYSYSLVRNPHTHARTHILPQLPFLWGSLPDPSSMHYFHLLLTEQPFSF